MTPFLIDTHCHLQFSSYAADEAAVLERMRAARIWGITIGTALGNSAAGIAFAQQHEHIWATVGLHPEHVDSDYWDADEGTVPEHQLDAVQLERLAASSKKVVALGETGLDAYRFDQVADPVARLHAQERAMFEHLEVARRLDLPVVFHCRQALFRLAELLQQERTAGRAVRGVIHSFTGSWDEAKPLLDLGMFIAVNGIATFPLKKTQDPALAIDRTIERIPFDRLLLETDCPFLAPTPYRGQRNEPAYVENIASHVAKVRGVSLAEVAEQTTENALGLFRLMDK